MFANSHPEGNAECGEAIQKGSKGPKTARKIGHKSRRNKNEQ